MTIALVTNLKSLHQEWIHSPSCSTSLQISDTRLPASRRSLFSPPTRWTPWSRKGFPLGKPQIKRKSKENIGCRHQNMSNPQSTSPTNKMWQVVTAKHRLLQNLCFNIQTSLSKNVLNGCMSVVQQRITSSTRGEPSLKSQTQMATLAVKKGSCFN